jgi:hypothetical protein
VKTESQGYFHRKKYKIRLKKAPLYGKINETKGDSRVE